MQNQNQEIQIKDEDINIENVNKGIEFLIYKLENNTITDEELKILSHLVETFKENLKKIKEN